MKCPSLIRQWILSRALNIERTCVPNLTLGAKSERGVYLHRWYVIPRNRYFNVYLHRYLGDDLDRALHDHPWWSLSILLDDYMIEHTIAAGGIEEDQILSPGDIRLRGARLAHRLLLPVKSQPMTLFITGPRVREWGFHCPQGWRHWTEFVSEDGTDIGKGCGE